MKILVVGVNGFGKMHLSAMKNQSVSIVETKESVIKECKANFKVDNVYNNFNEAIKDHFDVVDLVVPHHLHKELAIKAMEAKSNVLIEKPIATTIEEGEEMIKSSLKNGVKFMVADQYFFDPSVRKVMELLKENVIGDVDTIIVRDQRFFINTGWRQDEKNMGGGALIDGGIHYMNTFLNFGGDYTELTSYSNHSGSVIQGEDSTKALFKFKSGAIGIFFYSWSYKDPPTLPAFEIIGSEGSIYEDVKARTSWNVGQKERTVYGDVVLNGKNMNVKKYDVYEEEINGFLESVKNHKDVPFDPKLALRDLRAVMDIYNTKKK
jgi:predicted dehydrogenase